MASLPIPRRTALVLAAAALVVLAVVGRTLAGGGQAAPAVEAELVPAQAPAAAAKLVVHVAGAVAEPGLYELKEGSRIADAVARAGGATAKADTAAVNLAAPLADGMQVLIPSRVAGAAAAAGSGRSDAGAAPGARVSLSSATLEQLDSLPGIGPVTAQKILDWRSKNGGFRSLDDLQSVPGIGPRRMEQLRDLVTP